MKNAQDLESFDEFRERIKWMRLKLLAEWKYDEQADFELRHLMKDIEFLVAKFLRPERDFVWKRLNDNYSEASDLPSQNSIEGKAAFTKVVKDLVSYLDGILKGI